MVEVDFDKILEVSEDLVTYEEKLPLLIRAVIMKKWTDNLNKRGLYLKVIQECAETKPRSYKEAVQELTDWCKQNKEYQDLIRK